MRYLPELDGLRALAVLAVVAFHARVPGFGGGFIGVDLFFVLSGCLITRVLVENPDLGRFYWRRAKRLVPPLAFMLATYLLAYPLIRPDHPHVRDAGLAFFYLSDYSVAFLETPLYLRHTWSLAVEEHFYLLWPLVFLRWRPSVRVLLVAYIVATAWRWGWPGFDEAYHRFDTRMSGLILGCLLAGIKPRAFPAWPGLLILAAACVSFRWADPSVQGLGSVAVELAAAMAILGTPPAWLGSRPLVYVGKLSYGIYLWHYPIARVFRDAGELWQITLAISITGSVVMAAISYHLIEVWARPRHRDIQELDPQHGMPEVKVPDPVSRNRV